MHFRWLALKKCSSSSSIFEIAGKISIFLASAGTFNVKNDNFQLFFSLSWLQMLNLPALLKIKNTRIGPFPWKRSVLQNPDRERTNQSTGICRGLGLPYNKIPYCLFVSRYTPYSKMAANKLIFCLHVN